MVIERVLLAILGVGFAVLLVLSIIFIYILIRIMRSLRNIAEKAEATTDNIGDVVRALTRKLAPMALSTLGAAILKKAVSHKKRGKHHE